MFFLTSAKNVISSKVCSFRASPVQSFMASNCSKISSACSSNPSWMSVAVSSVPPPENMLNILDMASVMALAGGGRKTAMALMMSMQPLAICITSPSAWMKVLIAEVTDVIASTPLDKPSTLKFDFKFLKKIC